MWILYIVNPTVRKLLEWKRTEVYAQRSEQALLFTLPIEMLLYIFLLKKIVVQWCEWYTSIVAVLYIEWEKSLFSIVDVEMWNSETSDLFIHKQHFRYKYTIIHMMQCKKVAAFLWRWWIWLSADSGIVYE